MDPSPKRRPQLPNSPLTEVVCELKFAGNLSVFSAWGELQRRYHDRFPKLYVPGALQGTSPLLQPVRLTSAEEDRQVLLAVNTLAYSESRYCCFDDFRNELDTLLASWAELCRIDTFTRLGLRFVNQLPPRFPSAPTSGRLHPCLKLELQGWDKIPREFSAQPVVGFLVEGDRARLRVLIQEPPFPSARRGVGQDVELSSGVLLDLDAFAEGPIAAREVQSLLEEAHSMVDEAFFGMITDEYLRYLGGGE